MTIHSQGTILRFTPDGGESVTVGKLTSVGEIAPDSEMLDVTTLDSQDGYREYIQGYRDAGEVELSGYHDASDQGQKALREAFSSGRVGAFEVVFPDGVTASFSALVKSVSLGAAEVDGAIGFGAVLRVTGAVSISE